jgi:beta-1,2-mannobiose phosphorylase / 1,2-beta-oligomannan phosphorylase
MKRHPANPLLTPGHVRPSAPGFRVRGVFNPAAARFGDEILLLLRVAEDCEADADEVAVPIVRFEDGVGRPGILRLSRRDPKVDLSDSRYVVYRDQTYLSTLSHLRLARSRDGVNFVVDEQPLLFPADSTESFGVEDARISRIEEDFFINYTCVSPDSWATALAVTRDFQTIDRRGIIFPPQNKDVCLFPEKINGRYCALHRPHNSGFGRPSIWYAESPDLIHWGKHQCLVRPRDNGFEDERVGGGAPCLKTSAGWLQIYHGASAEGTYRLFTLLLDLNNPARILKRASRPLLEPEADYEAKGFFGRVVFTNGVVQSDEGRVLIYYGAADQTTCLAETSIDELLASLDAS